MEEEEGQPSLEQTAISVTAGEEEEGELGEGTAPTDQPSTSASTYVMYVAQHKIATTETHLKVKGQIWYTHTHTHTHTHTSHACTSHTASSSSLPKGLV